MLKPVRTVAPAVDMVTAAEVKAQSRIDFDDEDALIVILIAAVTAHLDGYAGMLGRALINQTWKIELGDWPSSQIRLPLAPVSAITSVKYYDADGVQQTLAASNYRLHEDGLSPYLTWTPDAVLPTLADRDDAIEVLFVAGYGAAASAVPTTIRQAALIWIATLYEQREDIVVGTIVAQMPNGAAALLAPYVRPGF